MQVALPTRHALIVLAILLVASLTPAWATTYTITDLGTLGGSMSSANGISNSGVVVGQSTNSAGQYLGFVWNNGSMHSTGTYDGGTGADAFAVNSSGQVAGDAVDYINLAHALVYSNGVQDILSGFSGGLNSYAMAINTNGVAAGYDETSLGAYHPVVWTNGVLTDLGTLGGENAMAQGINDSNHVVGYSDLSGNAMTHAFYWNGAMNDLGSLGGASMASAVNNSNVVVGYSFLTGDTVAHAFYWNGTMHDMGALSSYSEALAINNVGQIVGTSDGDAFLWQNGVMTNLNSLLPSGSPWQLEYANGINDSGQIVGWGIINGNQHAFLLSPQTTQQPPSPPQTLTASAGSGQIALGWTGPSGATSYNVYRATSSGAEALYKSGVASASYTDSSVTGGTTYYYKVAAVGAGGTSNLSNEAYATPPAPTGTGGGTGGGTTNGTQTVQIDCGGGASGSFAADKDFSGGSTWSTTSGISTTGVANAAPAAVYQSQRYGNFSYTIGGLTAGASYTVRLHFAETWFGTANSGGGTGSRVFNVAINGAAALSNFDVYKAAGAADKAVVESESATANSSGAIVITFTSVVSNAMVEGIEVVPPGSSSGGTTRGGGQAPGTVMDQINAGGGAAGTFSADKAYSGGTPWSTTQTISTSGVANAAPMAVYQTQRYGNFTYSIGGLTPGESYIVRLHFAESWFGPGMPGGGGVGDRVFNVTVNGAAALTNFDVYATAGGANKALVEPITTTANSAGVITVQFTSVVTNAEVNGLEVIAN